MSRMCVVQFSSPQYDWQQLVTAELLGRMQSMHGVLGCPTA